MPDNILYVLGETHISISGNAVLSGINQGNGSHLDGRTITLESNSWEAITVFDTDSNFQDSDNSQRLSGDQTFDGTPYTNNSRVESEYRLTLQDPDGNTYTVMGFNINEGGVSYATVEGLAFVGGVGGFPPINVPLTVIGTQEGPSDPYASLATPLCFTTGCRIATPRGQTPIEDLAVNDLVWTMDNGAQPIKWIGRSHLPPTVLHQQPAFRPIQIKADAFGAGCPERDIHLSPQHRVLVTGWQAELLFGEPEILVPITKLRNDTTIRPVNSDTGVTYYHLLFERHQIVWSDGMRTESYLPTAASPDTVYTETVSLFPDIGDHATTTVAARHCVSDKRTRLINQFG